MPAEGPAIPQQQFIAPQMASQMAAPDPSFLTTAQIRSELAYLREILEARLNAMDKATEVLQNTVTRRPTELDTQVTHLRSMCDSKFEAAERHTESIITAVENRYSRTLGEMDLRYQQRYDASDKALQAASLAAEKAVNAALAAAKDAVQAASISAEKSVAAALSASDKAIEKAESAQRAHNLSQNEWRATINDITKQVADRARAEAEGLVGGLRSTTDIAVKSISEKLDSAITRLDKTEGRTSGGSANQTTTISIIAIMVSIIIGGFAIMNTLRSNAAPVVSGVPLAIPAIPGLSPTGR